MARPKEFERDVVLDRAMQVFWSSGYEATSIQHLVDRMGIQRGSLYATFGDKRALFFAAIDHYDRVVTAKLLAVLEEPGSGEGRHPALLPAQDRVRRCSPGARADAW